MRTSREIVSNIERLKRLVLLRMDFNKESFFARKGYQTCDGDMYEALQDIEDSYIKEKMQDVDLGNHIPCID